MSASVRTASHLGHHVRGDSDDEASGEPGIPAESRVDLSDMRKKLLAALGTSAHEYWSTLKKLIAAKLSKHELDTALAKLLNTPQLVILHNQLISGIIHNANCASYPPPVIPLPPNAAAAPIPMTTASATAAALAAAQAAAAKNAKRAARPPMTPRGNASRAGGGPAPLAERADLTTRRAVATVKGSAQHQAAVAAVAAAAAQVAASISASSPRSGGSKRDAKGRKLIPTETSGQDAGPVPRAGGAGRHYRRLSEMDVKRQRVVAVSNVFSVGGQSSLDGNASDDDGEAELNTGQFRARYLPDFGTLRHHMQKIGRLNDIKDVSDDAVLLSMYALEGYLKDIIAKAASLRRPARTVLTQGPNGEPNGTSTSENVITATDLRVAVELNPGILGEGDVYSRERIAMRVSHDGA